MNLMIMGREAKEAAAQLLNTTTEVKNRALVHLAKRLVDRTEEILEQNASDVAAAEERGVKESLVDRLRLTPERVEAMAEGLVQIATLPDPIGEELEAWERPNGLHIRRVRVPFGVIGIIYESRPNVTADAFGLCFKTGNAVILRGGSDALRSNICISEVLRDALEEIGLPRNCVQMITDTGREVAKEFMRLNAFVDVLIPRGGAGLIRSVLENSTIPVIETGTGNCHVYVDETSSFSMALDIIDNAKTQRLGVCNACESLVVHEAIAKEFLPVLYERLSAKAIVMRGDATAKSIVPEMETATEEDYGTEYLDRIVSVCVVSNVDEAIAHINRYHTKHSDAIVTENKEHAERFLRCVDSACVYVNASTRFTDGFEFGFGAEIGISTQKLHARGPMGLEQLTSYKYEITGNGQIRE